MPIQDDQIPPGQPLPVRTIGNVDVAQVIEGTEFVLVEKAGEMYRVAIGDIGSGGAGFDYETSYSFANFPRPGQEKRNGSVLIYVDSASTQNPKAQYQWSDAQQDYYKINGGSSDYTFDDEI